MLIEARYYGHSSPTHEHTVSQDTTDPLYYLTIDQMLGDYVAFAQSFIHKGCDLSTFTTPWIFVGGSYAGTLAALMRVRHPEVAYGAIASSAPVYAWIDFWEYTEPIRQTSPALCTQVLHQSIEIVDQILLGGTERDARELKALFGLDHLAHEDFVTFLAGFGWYQAQSWDPLSG